MPELPEVETVRSGLEPLITNKMIKSIAVHNPNLRWPVTKDITSVTENRTIRAIKRRSKYLLIELKQDEHLIIHLGMSGILRYFPQKPLPKKHDHIIIQLCKGVMIYNDPRRFGCMLYYKGEIQSHPLLASIGPEPTNPKLDKNHLHKKLCHSKRAIKTALMDGNILPGIGNIYANEALFLSGIHPQERCDQLNHSDFLRLQKNAVLTIKKAIKQGGTTLKDFISADGKPGYFQQSLFVYGREGLACLTCSTIIERLSIASRASFICPNCQARKENKSQQ